ncbi:MAG TPA: hypothetical protein VKH40_10885 [Alloacidobacterium sp.]|nr:hypothetical protein [Alloacidobacterium sp.]
MRIILFGASGMVGQGVLRECLLDPEVEKVLAIGRSSAGYTHTKLRELLRDDLFDLSDIEAELSGYDACFFCLGVSSFGMTEEQYRRITFDLTLAAAQTLAKLNPEMTFIYVSGTGTDSSERGRTMWARVKGKTENALLKLPLHAYMFRPGVIVPLHGIQSRTKSYRLLYVLTGPILPWLYARFPKYVTTTERLGRAMIKAAKEGAPKRILESVDINQL